MFLQLDTNYGAPEQADESAPAPALYGSPSETVETDAAAAADESQATYAAGREGQVRHFIILKNSFIF